MSATFNDRQVRANFRKLIAAEPVMAGRALFMEGELEMGEAKRRTPVKTGVLRSSGTVSPPLFDRLSVSVKLSFGGAAAGYAIPVHENLGAFHDPGQAKFLETVILESRAFMQARVGKRIQSELKAAI